MKKAGRRRGTRSVVRGLLPAIEPYEQGMLAVSDGNLVYWETCGNPLGNRRWSIGDQLVRATDRFALGRTRTQDMERLRRSAVDAR